MSERATIEDTKPNEELDKELKKKCAEIIAILDKNKIEHKYGFFHYGWFSSSRLNCAILLFKIYEIIIHINTDGLLYISHDRDIRNNINKFDIEELIRRCEIIRTLLEYCKLYLVKFTAHKSEIDVHDLSDFIRVSIVVNSDYDNFSFALLDQYIARIKSNKIEEIIEYICVYYKELTKPRFLSTKPAKLY